MNKWSTIVPVFFLALYVILLFQPVFFRQKVPIPADTIVGLYYPWRDYYSSAYPSGIPFKNFLITDSVRQQYPWRELATSLLKNNVFPSWNPYSFAGTPLAGNLQSAPYYPFNFLFWLFGFAQAWSFQVMLQTILGGVFMCIYLRSLKLHPAAIALGVLSWVGSGFFTAWLEWNTVVSVAIWLPLLLWTTDKIITGKRIFIPTIIFILSLSASFLAGYLQPFFYIFVTTTAYFAVQIYRFKKFHRILALLASYVTFLVLTSVQWLPLAHFIGLSARATDQANWLKPDWFLPWQHLAQFVAPDYFGNPATLNYFGVWNYVEFVGYVGIIALIMAMAAFVRKDYITRFFLAVLLISLVFILPTPVAKVPFIFHWPLISTSQPSRLVMVIDFCLSFLAALGLDSFALGKKKPVAVSALIIGLFLSALWLIAYNQSLETSLRNLILPTGIYLLSLILLFLISVKSKWRRFFLAALLLIVTFDLIRFSTKFEPFSSSVWLYPKTRTISFLIEKAKDDIFRIAPLDDRILPPNFSIIYRIQSISGYDPLYLRSYGEFIAAMENGHIPERQTVSFNRIIAPKNFRRPLFNLLGAKYVLSLDNINDPNYELVYTEGITKIYQNKRAMPRVLLIPRVVTMVNRDQVLKRLISPDFNPKTTAYVSEPLTQEEFSLGEAVISKYNEGQVVVQVDIAPASNGFLLLADADYPGWRVFIDNKESMIIRADYLFRAVIVPFGKHTVKFTYRDFLY